MDNKTKGISYMLLASFCFAIMSLLVKIAGDVPSVEKSFFRNIVSCVVALVLIIKNKESFFGKKENQKYLLGRSILGTLGVILYFYCIDNMVLSDSSMLNKLSPFFVIVFSALFLKERITKIQLVAIIAAFLGSLLIIKPSFNMNVMPALIGVASAAFAGGAYTFVRFLRDKEKYYTIVFYFSFVSILFNLPLMIMVYKPLTLNQLLTLLGAGVFASIAQFSLTVAYKYAPASEISIYDYANIIFTALLGMFLLGEIPDLLSILGYVVIISAGFLMFMYNKRKAEKLSS